MSFVQPISRGKKQQTFDGKLVHLRLVLGIGHDVEWARTEDGSGSALFMSIVTAAINEGGDPRVRFFSADCDEIPATSF